ncbi:Predicted flavoprotein CzcO associated with the cation diffusion facilitator CzcD [Saccharopolyspora shandongensis]|uniref:Predicted flavoprotein CzcO associated with the cation diffusion facilitator CzcD n=1 Tax=Saccharopolyspora shandongensis TaxID=418495 RepID=A0A1H3KIF0_9PSEU|nr:NAD(P)/FAD-dependent oxidoreductase [Saccharopolyspora shandongensis]SDY51398.1 Predicted flavoprotein CzcO associated with the cation diffusion facilitator CzcD [Saccharopolyspora shandongensis]
MSVEHVDVLIVGAGVSGVGAACHLQKYCPATTFTILEGREAIGGTWDLFRYPGIRSDSDMSTLGYSFRPWDRAKSIAGGAEIRSYVADTAAEHGVDRHIRFGHRVIDANWSSDDARWTVRARRASDGEEVEITCSFLFSCTGYYDYEQGFTPDFRGIDRFSGQVVHPQLWPEDLDYAGKRVVVIGSGATAVTLVPAMAETAGHVTMLQRSPTYLVSRPGTDPFAVRMRRSVSGSLAHPLVRWKSIATNFYAYQKARRAPERTKALLRNGVEMQLPDGYDIDTHFTPRYNPWDQRLCLVPDGDFFTAVREGRASVVTDHIHAISDTGIALRSGDFLEADVIVTATGLNMLAVGGMHLTVDGTKVNIPEAVAYKGMMLSEVPNFAFTIGYINSSWTLRAELVARYVCHLLNHMRRRGLRTCMPLRPKTAGRAPLFNLTSGYAQRGDAVMPKQGGAAPWRMHHNFLREWLFTLRRTKVHDSGVRFS